MTQELSRPIVRRSAESSSLGDGLKQTIELVILSGLGDLVENGFVINFEVLRSCRVFTQ